MIEGGAAPPGHRIHQDEFALVIGQIHPIPELIGLAAASGEPVRNDVVAMDQDGGVGAGRLGEGGGGQKEESKNE